MLPWCDMSGKVRSGKIIIEFNDSPVSFTLSPIPVVRPMNSLGSLALSSLSLKLGKAYFESDEA